MRGRKLYVGGCGAGFVHQCGTFLANALKLGFLRELRGGVHEKFRHVFAGGVPVPTLWTPAKSRILRDTSLRIRDCDDPADTVSVNGEGHALLFFQCKLRQRRC